MSSPKHDGVIVPMLTPFTAEGRLDEAAAERLVDQLAVHGLHVFVLGTTGESASVPRAQRQRLVDLAKRIAGQRVRVYAGISDNSLEDSIAAGRAYLQAGVDAVVAHAPWFFPLNDAEIKAWLTARYSDFVLYDPPLHGATLLLWFGPALVLLAGGAAVVFAVRRRARVTTAPAAPQAAIDTEDDW